MENKSNKKDGIAPEEDMKCADDKCESKEATGLKIGFALCGSYCTFAKVLPVIEEIAELWDVIPIFSDNSACTDTRFGAAGDFVKKVEKITKHHAITNIKDAEPIGPQKLTDVLVVAPCTGNTIAKIANGIADTTVTLAVKSHLRNNRPVVIGVSTNDGLGANAVNIGRLFTRKNIYLVPFGQDDFIGKENSLVADFKKINDTVKFALSGKQLQPVLI